MNNSLPQNEVWKPIPSWSHYEASNLGRIRSCDRIVQRSSGRSQPVAGRVLKPSLDRHGYEFLTLCHKAQVRWYFVHTLVARAFLGQKPEGLVVNHLDGDRRNNRPENLEYCSIQQNARHAARMRRERKAQEASSVSV
jgi:HNH endonuclease/NUMOD4 motif